MPGLPGIFFVNNNGHAAIKSDVRAFLYVNYIGVCNKNQRGKRKMAVNFSYKASLYAVFFISFILVGCGGGGSGGGNQQTSAIVASPLSCSSSSSSSVIFTSSSQSSVVPGEWELTWYDEFDGAELDADKWSFERNCRGGFNNELQCYTNRQGSSTESNVYFEDGVMHIVAREENFSGQAKQDDEAGYDVNDTSANRGYTSARLRTKYKGDWKYGRIEVRAKLPQGQGIWPAIWMLPTYSEYGGWPYSGEIDIMEAINSNTGSFGNTIHGTLHFGGAVHRYPGQSFVPEANIWDEFHTYTVEWEEGTIRWYVDDTHYATQISDRWYTERANSPHAAPFDKEFHLLINLAVGGNWPGIPNVHTVFPQTFSIDFVHIYQCDNGSPDGRGCATDVNPEIDPLPGYPKQ
jgi:beta-glucanase (GH16 family)